MCVVVLPKRLRPNRAVKGLRVKEKKRGKETKNWDRILSSHLNVPFSLGEGLEKKIRRKNKKKCLPFFPSKEGLRGVLPAN